MAFENDPEAYRIAAEYAGADFDKARTVRHEPLTEYSFAFSLAEFQKMITDAVESIPPAYRDSAIVELEGYESSKLCISYNGPESEATVADRVRRCEEYLAERRRSERATYESLKKKFG